MLNIIFRSCSRPESQVHGNTRIVSKPECTYYCLKSIVNSAKQLNSAYKITVIDDNSHFEVIEKMKGLLRVEDEFFNMVETGNGESLSTCYKYADDFCNDLIYFVEDDYLHEPNALIDIVESYYNFLSHLGGKEVCIFPLDCNDRYRSDWMEPCFVVPGKDRYWRTVNHTTGTFLIHKNIFVKFRELFEKFTLYGKDPDVHESTTINKIWRDNYGAICFSPMPTLIYHLQLESHLPFYSDWKQCWNKIRVDTNG